MIASKHAFASAAILILLFVFAADGQATTATKNLPNFFKVNDKLYRGGQPKETGFAELKQLGIATVIDLRDDDENALKEKKLVEAAGMRFINLPLGNWSRPDLDEINKIIATINASENQPVFVHCRRGSDRTGMVIAVFRMTHDDWTGAQAADEAAKFGIAWWQFGMRDFINDYYRDHVKKIHRQ